MVGGASACYNDKKIKLEMVKINFQKSTEWTTWTLIFALVQFWMDLATKYFKDELQWFELLKGGPFLFVVLAVVIGIAMDFFLDPKKAQNMNFSKRFTFFGIPTLVIIFVLWAYTIGQDANLTKSQRELFITLNFCALGLCTLYAVATKAYLYTEVKT